MILRSSFFRTNSEGIQSAMGSESDLWSSPSESELSEMRARRERSDKNSKLMSEYLLKGYRMLATCCPDCGNIMMADKQGRQFCVGCEEVDKPPITQKQQQDMRPSEIPTQSSVSTSKDATLVKSFQSSDHPSIKSVPVNQASTSDDDHVSALAALQEAKAVLISKLRSATKRLEQEENPAACIDYASMIKSYSEALTAVSDAANGQKC